MRRVKRLKPGMRFGRLTVISDDEPPVAVGRYAILCKCECGAEIKALKHNLNSGNTRSCGCMNADIVAARRRVHDESDDAEYRIYIGAKKRCTDPSRKEYKYYGGRGIEFRFDSFHEFLAAVGKRPSPDLTLERIDNNKHYEKGNLRWETRSTQLKNRNPYKHRAKT